MSVGLVFVLFCFFRVKNRKSLGVIVMILQTFRNILRGIILYVYNTIQSFFFFSGFYNSIRPVAFVSGALFFASPNIIYMCVYCVYTL